MPKDREGEREGEIREKSDGNDDYVLLRDNVWDYLTTTSLVRALCRGDRILRGLARPYLCRVRRK